MLLGSKILKNWNHWGTTNWTKLHDRISNLSIINERTEHALTSVNSFMQPKLWRGFGESKEPGKDTILDSRGWGKGVVFLNGHNLGRYWPQAGPQVTLYVPAVWMTTPPKKNKLILINFEKEPCENLVCPINFIDNHIIDAQTPYE